MTFARTGTSGTFSPQTANGDKPATRPVLKSAVCLYSFSPAAVVHPTTEEEIVQVVQAAAQQDLKVRAIGSLHSLAPIPATDGVCIVLEQYKNLVSIEGNLVTVQAGMKLWELNQVLAQHHLALPVMGTIVQQTVAGAISTGTHGGSLHHQSLSGYVQSLRLIRADGSVLELDRSNPLFNAVVISMGLLGIVSTVTFQCVPTFSLQSEVCAMPMEMFLQQFDHIQQTNQYVDMRYSPITDTVQLVLINPAAEPILENGGWQPTVKTKQEWKRTDFINKLAQRLFNTHKFNWLQRWGFAQYDQTVYTSPYGRSDFVLTHFDATSGELISNGDLEDLDPVSDMEIAIPYAQAQTVLTRLRDYFHKTRRYPSMHIHLRCTAADEFWLSPAYGQAICWLEFWEYPCTGKFFQEMVELLKPFHFRGHWGKQIPVDQAYLKQQYDQWTNFLELRQTWDPDRMFSNICLDSYFCS
ncbi:MAG: D-arabinono-1,4-lactone oxidase [Kovacikia sp.]